VGQQRFSVLLEVSRRQTQEVGQSHGPVVRLGANSQAVNRLSSSGSKSRPALARADAAWSATKRP
jgi:hypothetical protein